MASIRIDHGIVLTMDPQRRIIKDGSVVIEGDRIVAVGKTADLAGAHPADQVLDATDKIVMPGLVDCHVHHCQTLLRGLANDIDLIAWCYDITYPYESVLTDEDTYLSALLADIEMIRTGTTTVADPGGYRMDHVARALIDSGLRGIICWAAMDQWSVDRPLPDGLPGKTTTDEAISQQERLIKEWHGAANGRLRASCGLRVEPNVSDALYRRTQALSEKYGVLVQFHAAVNRDQVEWVRRHTGQTTIEHMHTLGVLQENWLLTHMAVLTDHEVELLYRQGTRLCHNPGATLKGAYGAIRHGKFPEMIEAGLTVGTGCDSTAANDSLDMFRTMYLVATAHKEFRLQADLIPPEKALEMATITGAKALMWDDQIGSLEPGKKADVIVVDVRRSNWVPLHDFSLVPTLVYSGDGADVETSIVDGQIVMRDRRILTVDVDDVLERAQHAAKGIVARLRAAGVPHMGKLLPRWPVV
ncbi:MAG TPA: amidohydrolase [Chloroflexota bacterium]|nr:amidohydrolase [Chloroflexota bacterium]HZU07258.1 amidohydrolase [Chloroflexota bacterium]